VRVQGDIRRKTYTMSMAVRDRLLNGGYQGEWFGHILWTRSTDMIDGADRRGGWLRLSDHNIPEYIDG
jgi:hypothetical protein